MKKILLSTVALMGLTVAAGAADLPRRTVAPIAPIVAVPVFTWTGFYVGVNAGYGWGNNNNDAANSNIYFLPAGSVLGSPGTNGVLVTQQAFGANNRDNDEGGFVGGAQIGYNMQFGAFVAGFEADLQFADIGGGNRNNQFFSVPGTYTFAGTPGLALTAPAATVVESNGNSASNLDWFGTARVRLGVAFDRVLVYGTGGVAFGSGGDNNNFNNNGFCGLGFNCHRGDDDIRVGYAVGGGVEYAFTNNLTFKIEGLYVNLGDNNNHHNNGGAFSAVYSGVATNQLFVNSNSARGSDTEIGLVRVGLNYKF